MNNSAIAISGIAPNQSFTQDTSRTVSRLEAMLLPQPPALSSSIRTNRLISDLGALPRRQNTTAALSRVRPIHTNFMKFLGKFGIDPANASDLDLRFNQLINDNDLVLLKESTLIYSLNLQDCSGITDDGLAALQHISSLRSLNLTHCVKISDESLEYLQHCPGLRKLNLSCCNITDVGLEYFPNFMALRSLSINSCPISNYGLEFLSGCTSLQSLDLGNCRISIAGLASLLTLPNLRYLNLKGCKIFSTDNLNRLLHFGVEILT